MNNKVKLGLWRHMFAPPAVLLGKSSQQGRNQIIKEIDGFMTPEHRRVHHFTVRELPGLARPMPTGFIAEGLGMSPERVESLLADLEAHMTFLARNQAGEVTWAYPVTVQETPHRLSFSSGESIFAAWAVDAFATPFVQGRLRNTELCVTVDTECAQSGRAMRLEIDSELNCKVLTPGADPVAFAPHVDLYTLQADNIIADFWMLSVFFWSEEQAKAHRKASFRTTGVYLRPEHLARSTRMMQSALFGFDWSPDD